MKNAGFEIVDFEFYPMTGASLAECREKNHNINCVAIGK